MAENDKNFDSLGEQANLINIALRYTNGNVEKAKLMAGGQYNDIKIIKGKFSIGGTSVYGITILFVNFVNKYLANVNTLLTSSSALHERIRVFDNWKTYYADLNKYIQGEGGGTMDSYEFTSHLADSIIGYDIFVKSENEDLASITEDLKEIISKFFEKEDVLCQVALENANSLSLDLAGIPIESPGIDERGDEVDIDFVSAEDKLIENIEKSAEYVINGVVIVSPVRGKYIHDIARGEAIKVLFAKKEPTAISIARKLNAYTSENEFLPVRARVKEKIRIQDGGYIIYGVIAKNILVKIIEAEDVKIEMDVDKSPEQQEKSDDRLIIYIAVLFGLIILSLIVILNIL